MTTLRRIGDAATSSGKFEREEAMLDVLWGRCESFAFLVVFVTF